MSKSLQERGRRKTASRANRHVSDRLRNVLACHQAGDVGTAVRLYREVISANPRQAVTLHHLGLIAHQQGRSNEAVEFLVRALASDQRAAGEDKTQLEWKTEHPLAHRLVREYLICEQGRILGHAARAATGAESAALTAESDQAFLVAGFTAYP